MGILEQLGLPVEAVLSFSGIVVLLIAALRWLNKDKNDQLLAKEKIIEKLDSKVDQEQQYSKDLTEKVLTQSAKTDSVIEGLTRVVEAMK